MNLWAALMLAAGGLFAGGAATFAWSRVPIWRRMAAAPFVTDFGQTIRWTDKVQPALLVGAIIGTIGYALGAGGMVRIIAGLAAVGFAAVLLASVAVMVPLQRRIIATPVSDSSAIEAMRLRWFSGNLGRSVLATASFLVAVASVVIGTEV